MVGDQLIQSVSNSSVKQIRALRHRRDREEQGSFFIEGIRIVAEAVQTGAEIKRLVIAPELLTSAFAWELVETVPEARRLSVSKQVFASLSEKEGPQGLAAVIGQWFEPFPELRLGADELWVALDAPQDPGNVGTIMRTADAVGATGLVLIGDAADPYDPRAVRASMGSLFSMRLTQTDIPGFMRWQQENNVYTVGTSGAGSEHYRAATYRLPMVLLSGSEREGLPEELLTACRQLVRIPMVGRCDSLNLAVATSVVLYQAYDQIHR